jgi:hypothetical protein
MAINSAAPQNAAILEIDRIGDPIITAKALVAAQVL